MRNKKAKAKQEPAVKVPISFTVENIKDIPVDMHNALQEEAAIWAPHLGKGVSLRALRTAFYAYVINEGKQAAQEA